MYMYISIDTQQTLRPNGLHVHVHTYIRTCTYMYFTHANYIYMYLIDEVVTAGIPKIHKGTRRGINCWVQVIMCSRSPPWSTIDILAGKTLEDGRIVTVMTCKQKSSIRCAFFSAFLPLLNCYHTTQQLARSRSPTLPY